MNNPTIIVSICAGTVSFLAFCVSIYTVFSNRKQKQIDNLIALHTFLHQPDRSEARQYVREKLPADATLTDDKVRQVCSSFDFAGTLVRHHAVEGDMFFDYWSTALLSLEKPLSSLATKITGENVTIKEYYKDFWWLIAEAKKRRG